MDPGGTTMDKKEVRSLKITKFLACFVLLIFGLSFFLWPDDRAKDFAQSIGLVLAVAGIIEALILLIKSDKDTRGIGFIIQVSAYSLRSSRINS